MPQGGTPRLNCPCNDIYFNSHTANPHKTFALVPKPINPPLFNFNVTLLYIRDTEPPASRHFPECYPFTKSKSNTLIKSEITTLSGNCKWQQSGTLSLRPFQSIGNKHTA